jgi:peptide chain release factor 1|tara:strand:+ start:381 stop:1451 length:1071 start_codon:yes stop_codon:yes gene_type:complete
MDFEQKLKSILKKHRELSERLSQDSSDPKKIAELSKEFSDLSPIVENIELLKKFQSELQDLDSLIQDNSAEDDVKKLAEEEKKKLDARLSELEKNITLQLLPKEKFADRNVILEVRAGTGGDEASLFAVELFRMYQRYSENKGWKFEYLSINDNGIGGYKEAIALISGKGAFNRLKYESGTHRVQRVPETESGGRIHTSAATVAVLPEAEELDLKIQDNDLRVDVFRSSGPGGQSVNTTDSAVRITHIPSGVVVTCQDEKSQHKNKAKAMKVLRSRLYEEEERVKQSERAEKRKNMIGSGDRSERIRTYNFPQGRVTDHRINLTAHKIDQILSGENLDEIIDPLVIHDQEQKIANL